MKKAYNITINIPEPGKNYVYSNGNYYHTINILRNLADLLEKRVIKIKRKAKK